MFDLRYHVASLAAVFLALVIGILVGVGHRRPRRREDAAPARDRERRQRSSTRRGASRTSSSASREATQDFVDYSYPALMAHRLDGKRVALVFVGSVDDDVRSSVEKPLGDAGGGSPSCAR